MGGIRDIRYAYNILVKIHEVKRPFRRPRHRWLNMLKYILRY